MNKHRLIKAAAVLLLAVIFPGCLCAAIPAAASAESVPLDKANAVYVYNIENDRVITSKNADAVIAPGPTVKIMSGLLICDALGNRLDEKVTVTENSVKDVEGRYAGLKAGDTPTVRDLIYMGFCGSYNDAIKILELTVCGSEADFVALMNKRAGELEMYNTVYTNATGVDSPSMHSTAADIARLSLTASKNELLMTVTSAVSYKTEGLKKAFDFNNFNKLHVSGPYRNSLCRGLNAGSTPNAGYSVVTIAEKEGLSYLCVVMGSVTDDFNNNYSFITANKLINMAFDSYGYVRVIGTSDVIAEIPVKLSMDIDSVLVIPEKEITMFLPLSTVVGKDITWTYSLTSTEIEAPVIENARVGQLTVFMGDEALETIALVTKSSVSKSEFLTWMEKIKAFSGSTFFRASIICAAVLTVLYIVSKSILRASSENSRRNRHYR